MVLSQYFGWGALAVVTLVMAGVTDVITLPEPSSTIVLERATDLHDSTGEKSSEITLPLALYPSPNSSPQFVRYQLHFELHHKPSEDLFLFIPSINKQVALMLNDEPLFEGGSHTLWLGPLATTSVLTQLPRTATKVGRNVISLVIETGPFVVPTYLSRIYIGPKPALEPSFAWRIFFGDQLKTMAAAAHFLLGVGLIVAFFFRPNDPLFSWLAAYNILTLIIASGMFVGFQPSIRDFMPYLVILLPTAIALFVGVALALINVRPPRTLALIGIIITCCLLPLAITGTMYAKMISAFVATALVVIGYVVATGLLGWGALWRGSAEARLMLAPTFLLGWFAIRDTYVAATLPAHEFNVLGPYARPLFLAALTVALMRRMGISLNQLDRANEILNARLAEREAELAVLHRQERTKTASRVREHERQRLTHDLHDGISGHLVSIIAMSEKVGGDVKPIEQAAREALNDLRLVIYSLDLGDRELPLALANFRERLAPQLQRLGINLDWSIAALPEVSGVTPGNALAILRILQEAITNAVKHGPAQSITIRGRGAADGMVEISIENDGQPFNKAGSGHGLANMRRRTQRLHGKLAIGPVDGGVKMTLLLPSHLPDFSDDAPS